MRYVTRDVMCAWDCFQVVCMIIQYFPLNDSVDKLADRRRHLLTSKIICGLRFIICRSDDGNVVAIFHCQIENKIFLYYYFLNYFEWLYEERKTEKKLSPQLFNLKLRNTVKRGNVAVRYKFSLNNPSKSFLISTIQWQFFSISFLK